MTTNLDAYYESKKPAQNSTDNDQFMDVIGQKTDTHSGDSIYAILKLLDEHAHEASRCYPDLAGSVTLTSAAGVWTLGALTEIVPANTITDDFDIHWVSISSPDTNAEYQVNLYYGATDIFAGCISFTRTGVFTGSIQVATQTLLIPANSRIRARMADSSGSSTANIKIKYHTY